MKKNSRVERFFKGLYSKLFKKLVPVLGVGLSFRKKKKVIQEFEKSKEFKNLTNKNSRTVAKILSKENNKKWVEQHKKVREKGTLKLPSFIRLNEDLQDEVGNNVSKFITSIPKDILELNKLKYVKTLQNNVINGTQGRQELEGVLKELGAKNAKSISRTETSRLQTLVIRERSLSLGAKAYLWSSSNDQRTRESHKEMKNVIVLWSKEEKNKPELDKMFGNPGELPNCRCSPEPIFDERDLPSGNMLKFYNPETKKVEKISRRRLLEIIGQ